MLISGRRTSEQMNSQNGSFPMVIWFPVIYDRVGTFVEILDYNLDQV